MRSVDNADTRADDFRDALSIAEQIHGEIIDLAELHKRDIIEMARKRIAERAAARRTT